MPELPRSGQYTEYALAQRQSLANNLTKLLSYWRCQLEDLPPLCLPRDHKAETGEEGRIFFAFEDNLLLQLRNIATTSRISLSAVILAAFQLSLGAWCRSNDVVTAVNCADRVKPQFLDAVGYLIASVPVRSVLDPRATFANFLRNVGRAFYDAFAHRDLSYDLYDDIFSPAQPFCPVLFNFIPCSQRLSKASLKPALSSASPRPFPHPFRGSRSTAKSISLSKNTSAAYQARYSTIGITLRPRQFSTSSPALK